MAKVSASSRLVGFFDALLAELGDVYCDTPEKEFAVERFRTRARKRAEFNKPELRHKAFSDFLEINKLVGEKNIRLQSLDINNARLFIETALERYTKSEVPEAIQETLSGDILLRNWRFGPGASNGVSGTHAAVKISQRMTCTARAEPLVAILRKANPYFNCYDAANGSGTAVVSGSRLEAVPKNEDTWRTIAIEPMGNMVLQLAAGRYLEDTLRYIGLDISNQQTKNKRLAKIGSLDGSLATIDMKSASDMIKLELVRLLFPKPWWNLIQKIRSPSTKVQVGKKATEVVDVDLNMVSTMGNGFTFPLMTLILSALIYAYRCRKGGPNLFIDWSQTAVFGDDVIVYSHEYDGICETFESAGFVINKDKSFSTGPFRESCGGDYYLGYDCTPVYVRSLLRDTEIFIAINQIVSWCATHKVFLPGTLIYLKSLLQCRPYLVPEWCSPYSGILTAQCGRRYKYLKIKVERFVYKEDPFMMMLAIAGYIDGLGHNHITKFDTTEVRKTASTEPTFTPRAKCLRVRVKDARLPRGYLDGANPLIRTASQSQFASMQSEAIFG